MFIQTEQTPNPQTLKFLPGKIVMDEGTAFYQNVDDASNSPFAKRLFEVEGVEGVFFGSDFITITKNQSIEWQVMKPLILGSVMDHYNSGELTITKEQNNENSSLKKEDTDSDIVKQIKELLDTRVRPAVAMDGGDIIYDSFKDGIVYLHMQGACSGCPSSTATLKMGIENMLKHYIPEVQEVRPMMHKLLNFICFPILLSGIIILSNGLLDYNTYKIMIEADVETSGEINNKYSEKEITLKGPPVSEKLSDKFFVKVRTKPINPKIISVIKNSDQYIKM